MIKVLILNACINFGLITPVDYKVTITEAKTLQRASDVCRSHYKGCLKTAELKIIKKGRHFNILCSDTDKTQSIRDFNFKGVQL